MKAGLKIFLPEAIIISRKKLIGISLVLTLAFSAAVIVKTLLFAPDKEVRIKTGERREEAEVREESIPPEKIPAAAEVPEESGDDTLININTADRDSLESLPGIGPALAEAIISHREENGFFESKEEIMDISGIGQAKFRAVSGLISVGD